MTALKNGCVRDFVGGGGGEGRKIFRMSQKEERPGITGRGVEPTWEFLFESPTPGHL